MKSSSPRAKVRPQALPHRHTGHRTHRRTTSYPMLAMIVLCVGVFLMSWTRFVTADSFVYPGPQQDSYDVHASVPGPAPTQAATIDTPLEGTDFTSLPIDVSGSCPVNTYVSLYRNGAFSGVALCQINGTYALQTGLFVGANKLEARVYSLTDVAGPLSNPVNVTYTPPKPPTQPETPNPSTDTKPSSSSTPSYTGSGQVSGGSGKTVMTTTSPLIFKTSYNFTGTYVGEQTTWQLDLEGGEPPYAISVDWGDGTHSLISRPRAGVFSIDHTYKKAGGYKGSYTVKFSASDANGTQTYLQLITIVNNPPSATGITRRPSGGGFGFASPQYLQQLFHYVWPGYLIVVLMLLSFWLGERREYRYLKPHLKKSPIRHA